jgi:hypothetical protein
MTSREIATRLLAERDATASRKQARDLEAGTRASLRNHEGKGVEAVGEGMPQRWTLAGSDALSYLVR